MIFANINNLKEYSFLEENIKKCFKYLKENDLKSYENKSYKIDGDNIFVNITEYETKSPEDRFWEAHKKYLDLHVVLSGSEQIDLNFLDNMKIEEYVEKDDFLPMQGEKNSSVILRENDFLICYPNDAHKTGVSVNNPMKIKKAIFKIKL